MLACCLAGPGAELLEAQTLAQAVRMSPYAFKISRTASLIDSLVMLSAVSGGVATAEAAARAASGARGSGQPRHATATPEPPEASVEQRLAPAAATEQDAVTSRAAAPPSSSGLKFKLSFSGRTSTASAARAASSQLTGSTTLAAEARRPATPEPAKRKREATPVFGAAAGRCHAAARGGGGCPCAAGGWGCCSSGDRGASEEKEEGRCQGAHAAAADRSSGARGRAAGHHRDSLAPALAGAAPGS